MTIAAVVLSLVLAAAMLGSGTMKLLRTPQMLAQVGVVHVTPAQTPVLGAIEVAATVGLVVGLFWTPIGIAAAIGAVIYFVGAVVAHVRAHDRGFVPALVLALLSVATLVVLILR
ncbi:DoxX family protein [Curtobacterium sp. RRHDQ10]|uniref:DoxX family protein n=1 Tax=Curtobacterium phyllosphaerae TaxID=3413379 RepID=UPI003BF0BC08